MADQIKKFSLQMRKRKVDLKPGSFNQTDYSSSHTLAGSVNIDGPNRFSPVLPNLKLHVNLSLTSYAGGIGTHLIQNGNPEKGGDLVLSLGGSVGWGHNSPLQIDMMNQYSTNGVTNNNDFAIIYQSNIVFTKTGRNQINASIGLRLYRFTFATYNDVTELGLTDGEDRWLTGGFHLGYHSPLGGSVIFGSDIYTGSRIIDPLTGGYKTFIRKGQLYYEESQSDILLNQGSIYVKVTRKNGKFLMIDYSGQKAMFFQNLVHDHLVDKPRFMSVMPDTIMFYFGQEY